jgi:hypothetical protein
MSIGIREHAVLLAASYPAREYSAKADSQEIAAAVKALIGAVFQHGWSVVFGGHPTISPLILMMAREYGRRNSITIYQSEYFRNHVGQATLALVGEGYGRLEVIPNDASEPVPGPEEYPDATKCPLSLSAMRSAMIGHPGLLGLLLIGGDSGLAEESALFRRSFPRLPIVPLGGPGGIAKEFAKDAATPGMDPELRTALSGSRNYLFLCARIVHYLEAQRQEA